VGKSCQKIIWGQGWPKINKNQKGGPGEKTVSWEKEITRKNKTQKKIKTADHLNCPLGNSFIPSMKSQNRIFWMVHWWVLGHSSHVTGRKISSISYVSFYNFHKENFKFTPFLVKFTPFLRASDYMQIKFECVCLTP
jgi:hypothetical protein